MDDDIYRLMLDMSREKHSEKENQDIRERYRKVNQEKLFVVCREHELHGVAGAYAKSMGLPLIADTPLTLPTRGPGENSEGGAGF